MKKDNNAYIVIAPTGKSKIYSIVGRKISSKDRFYVIATCTNEVAADRIVDGLKLLQGEQAKIDTPLQRDLDRVRASLHEERRRNLEFNNKSREEAHELRAKLREAQGMAHQFERERDAAQKVAREKA